MRKNKRHYPVNVRKNNVRVKHSNSPGMIVPVNSVMNYNRDLTRNAFNRGKDGTRNFLGKVSRFVKIKKANGDELTMVDVHNFINTAQHVRVHIGSKPYRTYRQN